MARILIVEDEMNNLDVARRIVLAAGHEALVAMDGQTGLEIARVERPDAILMDLLLPKMDGWAVTRAIREEPWAAELPIIAVSALAMDADRERAREAGCSDFVTKPYAPAELRAVLNRYFSDGTAPRRVARATEAAVTQVIPAERLGTILVVDDEPANVELLVRRLNGNGYATITASNGHEAIVRAATDVPDLILMDVMMPGIDGWESTRLLKADPKTAQIPVIFVTARDRAEDVAEGFEVGGVMYVHKPFEAVELFARVRSALFTKRLQDDLRRKNEDLRRLEQSRLELIGMLGHDIRNLANSVVAFLQLARMGELTPDRPEFGQLLSLSESNIAEVLRMVNALLDVYKIEEGRLEAVPQVNDFTEVVERSLSQLIPEAMSKRITLENGVPAGTPVFVDAGLIVRVLTNLISNGIKHTPSGGTVRVTAEPQPGAADSIVVRVSDTGPGISEADAAHVFDRFFQTEGGRSRGGTGLGLAFCKLAIELHGGTIHVAGAGAPGAVVQFTIPAASRAGALVATT
ncbi:MAG TPA: response regulator [Candidatus Limnocylindria bacterium]|jgi:CheY-like chemotaxis protein